ncbi:MAG: mercuric ion transport protein [Methyloprofundus sp.]|nr:MAG: mercuric ion transport protein [Methyloprofundus sp.]
MAIDEKKPWLNIGAVLAAVGASVCCVVPLLLLSLGISGAWISTLTSFTAVRPIFIVLTLIFVGLSYRQLYLDTSDCEADETCALADNQKQKLTFWIISTLILFLLAFPWYAPYFMK